jgi:iron complex transport system permease protein
MTIDEIGMLILNRVGLGNGAINSGMDYLLFDIRLPRILMGVVIGAGLAVSGAAIQGLFRNPLADPALIGVTSGAMTFAVAGILFFNALSVWVGQAAITICSFAGSLLCTLLVYRLATSNGRTSVATMLLAGIAITALGGALTGLMTYFSTEEELRDITFWTLGSLSGATWEHLMIIAPIVGIALLVLHRYSQSLDLMLLGEHEAAYMGVNVQRAKWIIIICVAIIVGACVSFSGVIAFVALVVPHLVRLVRGPRHSVLLLSGGMLGAILLVGADMIARTIIAPAELPIGILTALLGAPFFIGLLVKSKQQLW